MRLRRRPEPAAEPPPPPRADHVAIAVMEYEELGIPPEPGTRAAVVIAGRAITPTNCPHETVVDIRTIGDPIPVGLCAGCGTSMIQRDGEWTIA
jgi:hypothetical protein